MDSQPARPLPEGPTPLDKARQDRDARAGAPARTDGRSRDRQTDGRTGARPSVGQSLGARPSTRRRWRQRELTASETRFVRWLEASVPIYRVKDRQLQVVSGGRGRMLYNGRALVGRYGAALIRSVLAEMMYVQVDDFSKGNVVDVYHVKYWNDELVSPAQFLVWRVKQEAADADEEGRR